MQHVMPITLSVLILMGLMALVVPLILWLLKLTAGYTLNIKAWGPEALKALDKPLDKYKSLFYKEISSYQIRAHGYTYLLTHQEATDRWYFKCSKSEAVYSSQFGRSYVYTDALLFNTKKAAMDYNLVSEHVETKLRSWAIWAIPLAILTDICLLAFLHSPVVTITLIGTVSTIQSTRWLSGKVASNVKDTKSNTSRIDELEKQKGG